MRNGVSSFVSSHIFRPFRSFGAIVQIVCVPMPTHCTITRFGFHTRRINGVKCGLFSNYEPLGQATLRVEQVSV